MADFITAAIPDGADVPKVDVRAWANTRVPQLTTVSELRSANFVAMKSVVIGAAIYVRVPSDTTSVDDGDQVIVDAGGNRWVRPGVVVDSNPAALRQIATHGLVPNAIHATGKQIMSRTRHFARDAISSAKLVYSNWFINLAAGEVGSGGTATITASIEYPAGTYTQVKFGGSTSATVANAGTAVSDFADVLVPDGAEFWVNTFATVSAGFVIYQTPIDVSGGSRAEIAASGLTDKTMSGTITDSGTSAAFGPSAIIGMTNRSSALIFGASGTAGTGDAYDASGFIGLSDRSIGPSMAFIKSARPSDKAADMVASHINRVALAAYVTDVVLQIGTNDINNGVTSAQLVADMTAIVGYFPGKDVYLCTVTPLSTSSDGFATAGNQTAQHNVHRSAYNDAVRAGAVSGAKGFFDISIGLETAKNSGIWMVPGWTTDGLHGTPTANKGLRDSGLLDASVMLNPTEPGRRFATPTEVGGRIAHDLHVSPQALDGNVAFLDGQNSFRIPDIGPFFTTYSATAAVAGIVSRRARGAVGAPSAVLSGDNIGGIWARGYGTTDFAPLGRGSARFYATQDWTDAAQGTSFEVETTPNGSTSRARSLYIDQDGSVMFNRIGTTASAANAFLDSAASNKLLRSTSSIQYKMEVENLEPDRADAILALRPVWYRSTAEADRPDWSWYGLIAEEVAEVEPRLVHWAYRDEDYEAVVTGTDEEGEPAYGLRLKAGAKLAPDGVQYERLTVMLLDIVKRQEERIAALEAAQVV